MIWLIGVGCFLFGLGIGAIWGYNVRRSEDQ